MSRAVLQPFENYQKARVEFVQTVADLAQRPQNIEALQSAGVMALLRPLLLDNVPSIQQSAALALGRLASYSDELAQAVVSNEILPQLVMSLSEQNVIFFLITLKKKKKIEVLQESCCLCAPSCCQTFCCFSQSRGRLWSFRCVGRLFGRI